MHAGTSRAQSATREDHAVETYHVAFGPEHNSAAGAILGIPDIRPALKHNFENRCYGTPTWGAYRLEDGRVLLRLLPSSYSFEYVYHIFHNDAAFTSWKNGSDRMESDPETGRRPYLYAR